MDLIKYHCRGKYTPGDDITELIGIDSEAYSNGEPFLFCLSDGSDFTPFNLHYTLLTKYCNKHFAAWNLKYDCGAILYYMPDGAVNKHDSDDPLEWTFNSGKTELWIKGFTTWAVKDEKGVLYPVKVEYIPHKFLKISFNKNEWIIIWDMCQFYGSGLNAAGKKYFNEEKFSIETKTFTISYVEKHLEKIIKYCIQDAKLTAKLSALFLEKLSGFGIRCTSLYSSASLSYRYFMDRGRIVHIRRFWKNYKPAVRDAIDAYEGGKFEITKRGYFEKGFVYDIVSAYPWELYNLLDISFAEIKYSRAYQPDASYGFIRCKIKILHDVALPCGLLLENTRIYAIGNYFTVITKNEYDYMLSIGVKIEIVSGSWFFVSRAEYPYRAIIQELFDLKAKYKKGDQMYYMLAKIMMNGFYGKAVQCLKHWKGYYRAGDGFNPFYASIITANTRIRVTRLQNELKDKCLAVHTDSIMTTEELPEKFLSSALGGIELQKRGEGVIVACGCYQIGKAGAFKGFEPKKLYDDRGNTLQDETGRDQYENWFDILKKYSRCMKIPYEALRVESIIEATSKGHFTTVNLFQNMPKEINLNGDIKRIWTNDKMRGKDYLEKLWNSSPRIITQREKPEFWK
jgi:hypothetical protein